MSDKLISKIPEGPLEQKWTKRKSEIHLVSPNNKRKLEIIVVGTGLGGASAAASLGELGYNVKIFCISDSPRRAHSIAAQGGINAAKNYQNDDDSVYRLFYDTIKGGDYRSREANVYRLAEVSAAIIDQCVAQGIPFAREYGGYLANRSFGGVQVSRTFYARGQTGQQLLLGAYASLNKEIAAGTVKSYPRHEMLDLVIVNGQAKGIITRNLVTGQIEQGSSSVFVNGKLKVDYSAGCAYLEGEELHLTPMEYKLRCMLSKNVGKVLTHTYLTQNIWGQSWENDVASLRVFMATLRRKLEKNSDSVQYIQTHVGIGYRMLKVE